MDGLIQATVHDTSSPANVYSTTIMCSVDGSQKILMISANKDIITLESRTVNDEYQTSIVELEFSNIPSNAEIIAIHCINRSKEFDDFVIGITYISIIEEQKFEAFLNVYSGFPGSSLEAVMENCETLELDFVPLKLNHAIYMSETHNKGMWLLSGTDKKIHAYRSDEQKMYEQKIEDYFIEFKDTNDSVVLSFDTKLFRNYKKRISFYGCDTGYSMLAIVDSELNQVLHCFLERYQSPITVAQFFNIYNKTANDDFIPDCNTINEKEPVCLLVASAIENAVVYMNVLKNNLNTGITLPISNRHQAIVCSLIADVNFDSKNEILLGTNENYILNYVYENNKWVEQPQFDMRYSVYNICYLDISGEGVNDLVVMSERGIHILKHRTRDIIEKLKKRLKLFQVKENRS